MEAELVRSKNDMMGLNNQLLEAIQKKLELSQELEAWQVGHGVCVCVCVCVGGEVWVGCGEVGERCVCVCVCCGVGWGCVWWCVRESLCVGVRHPHQEMTTTATPPPHR